MTISELLAAITAELSAIGAATDLGLVSQDGERVSTMLTIDDKCFRLSLSRCWPIRCRNCAMRCHR